VQKLDTGLERIGITEWRELRRNPSWSELVEAETSPGLSGLEHGILTQSGAVSVDTGRFTGRSPKDKYFVVEPGSRDNLWWSENLGSDNKPIDERTWNHLRDIATRQLNGKTLYIVDAFAGANPDTRLKVRIVSEIAWQAHFCTNMFIRPTEEELEDFEPDWTILNACKATCPDYADYGLRSEVFVANHIGARMTVIGGTWYGGEMKKGIFSIMNYFLPLQGIGSFHCSANVGKKGDVALFFGLSGTGKTTLSADPKRLLLGDDEHGWDDDGVFNFEGGCYAKVINLTQASEPMIYDAIKHRALLENVDVDANGVVDYRSARKTENTRVSYPLENMDNIVPPPSRAGHANKIIFLAADAFGVLPPVAKLTRDQAMYQYLSGYTAKVAGTELGVKEPTATFSTCFGAAFLLLHPTAYAEVLGRKMDEHRAEAYLVNTGWTGGAFGTGHRMALKDTRAIIDAILDGSIDEGEFETMPLFGFKIPKAVRGVDASVLRPRDTWEDNRAYDETLERLAGMFVKNFQRFVDTAVGRSVYKAGPTVQ
jgi:phosphoenolpyruvate carboxykinase (ATP)